MEITLNRNQKQSKTIMPVDLFNIDNVYERAFYTKVLLKRHPEADLHYSPSATPDFKYKDEIAYEVKSGRWNNENEYHVKISTAQHEKLLRFPKAYYAFAYKSPKAKDSVRFFERSAKLMSVQEDAYEMWGDRFLIVVWEDPIVSACKALQYYLKRVEPAYRRETRNMPLQEDPQAYQNLIKFINSKN